MSLTRLQERQKQNQNDVKMAKGIVEEIFSKAIHHGDPKEYKICYRNFERIIKISLSEFIEISDNFQTIPASRIEKITKKDKILFQKASRG